MNSNIYPRSNDFQTIYLNTVIKNPAIIKRSLLIG